MNLAPLTADPSARSFVLDSWRRSLPKKRRRSPGRSHTAADREREQLVDTQRVTLAVGDDGAVFGWICYTPLRSTAVVHYLYVRAPLRRTGIGRRLLEACGVALDRPVPVTQVTADGRAVAKGRARIVETQIGDVL